jgi:hypothetical protein
MTIIIGGIDGTAVYFKVSFYRGVKRKRLAKMCFPIIHLLLLVNEMSLSEMD